MSLTIIFLSFLKMQKFRVLAEWILPENLGILPAVAIYWMSKKLNLWSFLILKHHHTLIYQHLGRPLSHPTDLIIGDVSKGVKTRSQTLNECTHLVFLSHIEPKNINEALNDEF